ncbi:MAG: hypothetical protein H6Q84_3292, partial [Deltaproteobacteria bacterium]|nr:hypothetical protein [Deltaproteobacteria bacterium]
MPPKVSLVKTLGGIPEALAESLDLIGGLSRFVRRGDRVLLKPNLNGEECCTDKALAEAMVRLLSDFGAGKIFFAESTFGNAEMTDTFFEQTGYAELARRYGIPLYNLNRSEAVEVEVKEPLAFGKLPIAREVFEADRIVNLPNMKVHYATGITLALKNMKGLLVGGAKRRCHEVGLDKAIVDLNNTIRPHLNVVDAISCMERMGPRGGDIVRMDLTRRRRGEAPEDDRRGPRDRSGRDRNGGGAGRGRAAPVPEGAAGRHRAGEVPRPQPGRLQLLRERLPAVVQPAGGRAFDGRGRVHGIDRRGGQAVGRDDDRVRELLPRGPGV